MLHVPDETTRNVWVAADLPRCRQNVLLNAIDRDTKCIAFSIILGNSAYTSPCKQRDVDAEILSETENVNEHRIQLATSSPSPATFANCLTVYATAERPALNTKRKIENQIRVGLAGTFAQYSSSEKITLIVTSLPVDLIKSVTSSLNRSMTADEVTHVFDALCKTSGKSKEDMESLYDQMMKIFAIERKIRPGIILYRVQDGFHQIIF
ncbi:hypothetical protein Y032_0021g245 [Ancylostoma ceylanicum]|uniref:Uncharacterized protein n=1 Tax=Ancylostoma ceylanicum TaxID=53326 RepID=A0A016UYK7_9BILA|nr:hypothetical protein Y032_0021g245 [Ancylostoma ceylanicum]